MEENIRKRWEDLGFLEGLTEEKKDIVAESMEKMFKFLENQDNEGAFGGNHTIAFPMIRRIVENGDNAVVNPEELAAHYDKEYHICLDFFDKISKVKDQPMDIEALAVLVFCDLYVEYK